MLIKNCVTVDPSQPTEVIEVSEQATVKQILETVAGVVRNLQRQLVDVADEQTSLRHHLIRCIDTVFADFNERNKKMEECFNVAGDEIQ